MQQLPQESLIHAHRPHQIIQQMSLVQGQRPLQEAVQHSTTIVAMSILIMSFHCTLVFLAQLADTLHRATHTAFWTLPLLHVMCSSQ